MAERDGVEVLLAHGALVKSAADISRLLFDLGGRRERLFDGDGQVEGRGKLANEEFVGIGGDGAQVMVDVENMQFASEVAAELMKEM